MNILKQPSNIYQKQWLVAVMESDLSPATKLVATFLREIWWNDVGTPDEPTDSEIYASYDQIQRATHLSRQSIARAIDDLEDEGFLHQTNRSRKQGVANRYYPVRIDVAIANIVDDYLNPDLSTFGLEQSTFGLEQSTFETEQSTFETVNSYTNSDEVVSNRNTEESESSSLDYQTSSSLSTKDARSEHGSIKKFQDRQAQINADIMAEFAGAEQ